MSLLFLAREGKWKGRWSYEKGQSRWNRLGRVGGGRNTPRDYHDAGKVERDLTETITGKNSGVQVKG